MSNGGQMLNQLEFEKQIETWTDPEKFIARQVYEVNNRCGVCTSQLTDHEERIKELEAAPAAVQNCPAVSGSEKLRHQATGAGIAAAVITGIVAALHALGFL